MGRTPCCEKVGLKRGRWTAEEDEILINYIKQNGDGSWRSLPKNAGLLRCGKSCRLRWINYLRDDLKRGNFTRDEEETIIKLHKSLGNKWSLIASNLPGRTDNEVKNYWNSHLSRKIYSFRSSCNGSMIITPDMVKMDAISNSSTKRKGGRVSRALAKKYNMNAISSKPTTTTTNTSSSSLKSSKPRMIGGASKMTGIQEATIEEVFFEEKGNRDENLSNNLVIFDDKVEREGSFGIANSIDDINCSGLLGGWCESFLEMMEQENEVLGPDKWEAEPIADDPTTLLFEQFLQGDSVKDFSENSVHNSSSEGEEITKKSFMTVDNLESASADTLNDINDESENGAVNSSARLMRGPV